jgi:hypothetical protein
MRRFRMLGLSLHGDFVVFEPDWEIRLVFATDGAPPLDRGELVPGTEFQVGERVGRWYFARPAPQQDLVDFLNIDSV